MNWIARFRTLAAVGLIGFLVSCSGGGAGGGGTPYTITLRADRTLLPLNIAGEGTDISGRYTTTLYVEARDSGGRPIPAESGDTKEFACSVLGGLETGALYYLDGAPEHETKKTVDGVEVTYPNAYRAITLDSNSGSASFHFHAGDTAGVMTVRCTVSEPGTNIQRAVQATIQVGGQPTGKVSQIILDKTHWTFPGYLFVQGINVPNQGQMQASMVDEAGQAIPNPAAGTNNLQVRIVPDGSSLADNDATLRGVNSSGNPVAGATLHIGSINGQAQFTLVSGTNPGTVLLEVVSDRADNNVSNGIVEAIYNYVAVPVVVTPPGSTTTPTTDPLTIATETLPAAIANVPYGVLLTATGGDAPYTWTSVTPTLPFGLGLQASGVIMGTPYGTNSGTFNFVAKVTDSKGRTAQKSLSIAFTGQTTTPPVTVPDLVVTPTTGTGNVGNTLTFVVTGGQPGYSVVSNNASILTATVSSNKVTATLVGVGTSSLIVTDNSGKATNVPITVNTAGGSGASDLTITPTVGGTVAIGQLFQMMISGGTAPYGVTSTNISIGTVTPATVASSGAYFTFTPVAVGTVKIIVSDSAGAIKTVDMTVTQPGGTTLTVVSSSVNWKVGAGACTPGVPYSDFVVYGGVPPYTGISTSPLIVTIPGVSGVANPQGYYTFRAEAACAAEGSATLVFRDSVNATATAIFTIDIADPAVPTAPTVSPAAASVLQSGSPRLVNFVVSGGTPGYTVVSSNPSLATVSTVSGSSPYIFTATVLANQVGTGDFVVTDANGLTALSTLTVTP